MLQEPFKRLGLVRGINNGGVIVDDLREHGVRCDLQTVRFGAVPSPPFQLDGS
jgi:hypothetical protein